MKAPRQWFCFFIMMGLISLPLWAQEYTTVEVKGAGQSRHQAIRNALRIAVERVAGMALQSRSKTKNFELVFDSVVSRSGGYVKTYEVLNSRTSGLLIEVTVRAVVARKMLLNKIDAAYGILKRKGFPAVMVVIDEIIVDENGQQRKTLFHRAERYINQKLREYNFKVMDAARIRNLNERKRHFIITFSVGSPESIRELKKMDLGMKADIIIRGKAVAKVAKRVNYYGMNATLCTGEMAVDIIQASTGELMHSIQKRLGRGAVMSEAAVFDKVGQAVANAVKNKILKQWINELAESGYGEGRSVTIEIKEIDADKALAYIDALTKEGTGVKMKTDIRMTAKICEFDIFTTHDSNLQLIRILKTCCPGLKLKIDSIEKHKITMSYVPPKDPDFND